MQLNNKKYIMQIIILFLINIVCIALAQIYF